MGQMSMQMLLYQEKLWEPYIHKFIQKSNASSYKNFRQKNYEFEALNFMKKRIKYKAQFNQKKIKSLNYIDTGLKFWRK